MPDHMKQKQPALSVIVPVYNVEKYLDRCIRSIAGQTYTNLEIILVDDGSTDHCREICDEWSRKDTRIQVLHKKNGGLVSARKAGLKTASGQYIAYVDSDDWIEENMYERMMELMLCNHSDIVTSGLIRDYENHSVSEKEKIPAGRYEGKSLDDLKGHIINTDHFFDSRINMHITNKIFRKSMLEKYQMRVPNEAKIGEDADVVYPYIFESENISVSGDCFYHYVMRGDSLMGAPVHTKSGGIMRSIFSECAARNEDRIKNIKDQLYQVTIFFACISDPGHLFRTETKESFPFREIKKGDRVILYGAGRFGKAIKLFLENEEYCEIAAWADKVKGGAVISPEQIKKYSFDKIILAVINAAVADDIEEMLVSLRTDRQKICRVKI